MTSGAAGESTLQPAADEPRSQALEARVAAFLDPGERLVAVGKASDLPPWAAGVLPLAMVLRNRWQVLVRTDRRLLVLDAGALLVRPRAVRHELPADAVVPVVGRRGRSLVVALPDGEARLDPRDAGVTGAGAVAPGPPPQSGVAPGSPPPGGPVVPPPPDPDRS